jgi:hypothetical protein
LRLDIPQTGEFAENDALMIRAWFDVNGGVKGSQLAAA